MAGSRRRCSSSPGRRHPNVLLVHGVPNAAGMWQPFLNRIRAPFPPPNFPVSAPPPRPAPKTSTAPSKPPLIWPGPLTAPLNLRPYPLLSNTWASSPFPPPPRPPEGFGGLFPLNPAPSSHTYPCLDSPGWRRPRVGEFFTGAAANPLMTATVLRQARPGWRRMPDYFLEDCLANWDRGNSPPNLPPLSLAQPQNLGGLPGRPPGRAPPPLFPWAGTTPFFPPHSPPPSPHPLVGAELERYPDAGHWAWIDRPDAIERPASSLLGSWRRRRAAGRLLYSRNVVRRFDTTVGFFPPPGLIPASIFLFSPF